MFIYCALKAIVKYVLCSIWMWDNVSSIDPSKNSFEQILFARASDLAWAHDYYYSCTEYVIRKQIRDHVIWCDVMWCQRQKCSHVGEIEPHQQLKSLYSHNQLELNCWNSISGRYIFCQRFHFLCWNEFPESVFHLFRVSSNSCLTGE